MSAPRSPADPPLAEPAPQRSENVPGNLDEPGSAAPSADPTERRRSQPHDAARSTVTRTTGVANVDAAADDDADSWRHEPVAPVDEPNPLKSLGRAIAGTITAGEAAEPGQPKR
ncbi:MAG TPA: hypothetical protein VGI48_10400 [Caldimonas sp.]|jgi:hypothetical protein